MSDLRGVSPIVTTPFSEDGDVDMDSLAAVIGKHLDEGCPSVTLFGLASEFYKLTDAERRRILDVAIDACEATAVETVVSVSSHATRVAEARARRAEAAGADYLMVLPPFFLDPPPSAVTAHLERVAAAVEVPVIVQYAPGPTGTVIRPERFASLAAAVDNVDYFKIEATPPGTYISELLDSCPASTGVFVGNAGLGMLEAFDRGAVGVMPGSPLSDLYVDVVDAYDRGDDEAAAAAFTRLLPMLNHITQSPEMAFYYGKQILDRRDVIATAATREPAFSPDEHHDRRFEAHYGDLVEHFHDLGQP